MKYNQIKTKLNEEHSLGLLKKVAAQMDKDARNGDYNSIDELLEDIPTERLEGYLSDNLYPYVEEAEADDLYHNNVKKVGQKNYNDYKGIQLHNLEKQLNQVFKTLLALTDIEDKDNSSDMVNDLRNMHGALSDLKDAHNNAFEKLEIGRHRTESVTIDKDDSWKLTGTDAMRDLWYGSKKPKSVAKGTGKYGPANRYEPAKPRVAGDKTHLKKNESVDEAPVTIDKDDKLASLKVIDPNNRRHDDTLNEYSPKQIKMAFGILNDPRYRDGNYDGAYAAIEKLAKGLASHPSVAKALKRANESMKEAERIGTSKMEDKFYPITYTADISYDDRDRIEVDNIVIHDKHGEMLAPDHPVYQAEVGFIDDEVRRTGEEEGEVVGESIKEADKDGDGKEDLKGFDAKTSYTLKALQAKYPHADNLMSALMAQSDETNKRQDDGDKKRDALDKLHNKNIDTIEQKLYDVIKKNNLTEEKEKSIVNEIDPSRSPWTVSGKHPGAMSQRELEREIAVFDELRDRGDHLSPRELAQEDSLYHYLERSRQRSIGEMHAEDMQKHANRIIERAKWKKQRAEGIEDIAKTKTKQHTLPRVDTEKYQERDGLEGPIATRSGKVVYYDPIEGKYYDPDTDMYIEYDDMIALTR